MRYLLLSLFTLACLSTLTAQQIPPVSVEVDARDMHRRLLHTTLEVPCKPGTLKLWYPQWFPGSHGPHGKVEDMVGLKVTTSDGRVLPWNRDEVNLHSVSVQVPEGFKSVTVKMDTICGSAGVDAAGIYSVGNSKICVINWNTCVLYPDGQLADDQPMSVRLRLPKGWKHASALKLAETQDETSVLFQTLSLTDLIDRPLIAGAHLKTIPLKSGKTPPAFLHLTSEDPEATELPEKVVGYYSKLVQEAGAMFGVAHYSDFHFLVTLSDDLGHHGLEHLTCSMNGLRKNELKEDHLRNGWVAMLLPHEYTHSWCGKYRRPAGMITPNFHTPQKTKLLWVYEGLTQYLGDVLMVRCGLVSPEDFEKTLSARIISESRRAGRAWRSLEDTGVSAHLLRRPAAYYSDLRRDQDFYYEGMLLWLEIDAMIREKSKGAKTLDDFNKKFFAAVPGKKTVAGYEYEDVLKALNDTLPFEWDAFLTRRVKLPMDSLPLDFVNQIGYRLRYEKETTVPGRRMILSEDTLGMRVIGNRINNIFPNMPAEKAGLKQGMLLTEVNGKKYSVETLKEAITESVEKKSIEVAIKDGEETKKITIPYEAGIRYWVFSRDESKPNVLREILSPRVKGE